MRLLNGLDAVFDPQRVAVVGASDRAGTVGRLIWENLADYTGELIAVSRAESVFGQHAYPGLGDVPGRVDLAVVAIPAAGVLDVVTAAAAKQVGAVVVITAGFAEIGEQGRQLEQQLLEVARTGGVRLVGPNSFGIQNCATGLNASIAAGLPPDTGRPGISLVTQSGAYGMAVHAMGRDEATRFAKVYSTGNKADVADHELLAYLADDPATGVICLMLESISEPRKFFEQARRASSIKPVIVTLTGRTGAGRRAAFSHTASIATDDVLRDAMLRQAGVIRTRTGLQMLDAARTVLGQRPPVGRRVGIITNSGGTGVELADLLDDEGLTVPELSPELQANLREILPPYASSGNPVDMTPVWQRFPELYAELICRLALSGEVDLIIPVLLQRAASEAVALAVRDAVLTLRSQGVSVPVYACWVGDRAGQVHTDVLQSADIPALPWPERTAQAVGVAVRCAATLATGVRKPPGPVDRTGRSSGPEPAMSGCFPPSPESPGGPMVQRDLLVGKGITVARTVLCATAAQAVEAAAQMRYPVAVKVEHPTLTHKSDVGGVRLSLRDSTAVETAAGALLALAEGARVVVQQQHQGLELVVGAFRDPDHGPVVMVGFGGIHVEVTLDTRFALAPIDQDEAIGLWRTLRNALLLRGFRGAPAVDLDSLGALVTAIGDLMIEHCELSEIDLNPVLAGPDGYVVVDWRMVSAP